MSDIVEELKRVEMNHGSDRCDPLPGDVCGCGDIYVERLIRKAANEIERLRAALRVISESPHQQYDQNSADMYGIGVTDGHRCAAVLARAALPEPHYGRHHDN